MLEARLPRSLLLLAAGTIAVLLVSVSSAGAARGPAKPPRAERAVPGELIVRFVADANDAARDRALERAGAKPARALGKKHTKLVRTAPAAAARALKVLRADPAVAYAEPNQRLHALAERIPNDAAFGQLWGLRNTGQTVNGVSGTVDADIDAEEAWATTTGSRDVVVAVIDTGVDFSHPDLGGSETASPVMWTNAGENCSGCRTDGLDNDGNGYVDDWRGWDFVNDDNDPFDDEGHGTHVAGTIGALGDNGLGIAGVSWNARIMALKFLDATGGGTLADAIAAIRYATAMGAPITNNSWGGGFFSQALLDAIREADAAGSLFVAAAGNSGEDNDGYDSFPASYRVANVVSVAASDQGDALASFSNFGRSTVDVAAPGTNVYSTVPGGGYDWWDGTSMATPHVAGAAALARSAHAGATAVGLKALLLRTADARSGLADRVAADGRLNAARAVGCSAAPQAWVEQPGDGFTAAVGDTVEVVAIGTTCAAAAGTTVTAVVNGSPLALTARGDGLYTGGYVPQEPGPITVAVTATGGSGSDTSTVAGTANRNYRFADGPYAWVDATAGGTRLTLGDEDARAVALPFAFPFYGTARTSVQVGSNGYLVFGSTPAPDYWNTGLPDPNEPNGLAAVYWDDLDPAAGGAVWYRSVGTSPNRRFVVSWNDVPNYMGGNGVTFQAILEEATGDVVYQYADVDHGYYEWDWGASATVGVEDEAGAVGREFSWDTASLRPYQAAKSLRFSYGTGGTAPPGPDTTPPAAPTALTAVPGSGSVALDWADNGEADLAGYRVQLRGADGSWATVGSPTASAFTHGDLVNGTTYTYRVLAVDTAGNASAPSAEVSATPAGRATYAPTGHSAITGTITGGSLASLAADDGARLVLDSTRLSRKNFRAELQASTTLQAAHVASLRTLAVEYDGHVSRSATSLSLRVLNQRTGAWETVDGPRTSVTADRRVAWTAQVAADYVSSTGQVLVRVLATGAEDAFLRSDLISVTVEF